MEDPAAYHIWVGGYFLNPHIILQSPLCYLLVDVTVIVLVDVIVIVLVDVIVIVLVFSF